MKKSNILEARTYGKIEQRYLHTRKLIWKMLQMDNNIDMNNGTDMRQK